MLFYPKINEKVLNQAINWSGPISNISKQEKEIISLEGGKSFQRVWLFHQHWPQDHQIVITKRSLLISKTSKTVWHQR